MGLPVGGIEAGADFTIDQLKDLHPTLPFKSVGFRPSYFSFLFVKDAKGKYTTDDVSFQIGPGTVYFTNPGHFKSFEWSEIEEVILITFTETFLKKDIKPDIFEEFPFLLAETVRPKVLIAEAFQEFELLCCQIAREYKGGSAYKMKIVGSLMMILLLKIKDHFWRGYNPIYEGNRGSQIVKNFKKNLESHFRELVKGNTDQAFRVQDFADLQSLHASYLNHVIKSKTGKSVSTWMMEKTISEAKTLLQNADVPVKEIAYRLGFSEVSHFSNYFKKNTDQSPATYRRSFDKPNL